MIRIFRLFSITVIILTLFFSIKYVNGSNGNIYRDQFSFLDSFSYIPQLAQALPVENGKIKMRNFTIDTQGKSLFNTDLDIENDGKLIEYSNGKKIKDWKIKYEKKGHNRGVCEPPVINLSFDKLDSKGKAKELFTGLSTYKNNKTLQYQKIRLIPECDTWNDYYGGGDIGFSGQLNVNLREFMIHKIFRFFNVPTADVLGFANINIISSDNAYRGKTFRYMIIQRPQELDDQIPFTTQFNFKPKMYVSGDGEEWSNMYDNTLSKFSQKIFNYKANKEEIINFDIEAKMKFDLLTDLLNLSDMGFLHNEDGGIDINTGLVKSVPHGFDASFHCYVDKDLLLFDSNYADNSSDQKYKDIFYSVSREIFLDSKNLDKMLSFADSFLYVDVKKELLRDFLKIRFYKYSSYVNSREFAKSMNKSYSPIKITLPFKNNQEYDGALINFTNKCYLPKIDLKGVTVSEIKEFSMSSSTDGVDGTNISFVVDVKTGDKALQFFRKSSVFTFNLLNSKDDKRVRSEYIATNLVKGIDQNVVGPYYEIPPNTTVSLVLGSTISENSLFKGEYKFELESFTPNNNFTPFKLNYKTKSFSLGKVEPIIITSPKHDEIIEYGATSTYTITWSGEKDRDMVITLNNINGGEYYITNPNKINILSNKFALDFNKVYKRQSDNYVLTSLPEGKYSILVGYNNLELTSKEVFFNFLHSKNKKPIVSVLSVKAKLNYDLNYNESYIAVNSIIDITVPTSTTMIIPKRYAFSVYGRNEKGNYLDTSTIYTSNDARLRGENYELTGGKNYRFSLVANTVDVSKAFPGVYAFKLDGMSYGFNYENYIQFPVYASSTSNKLSVVGEKSPYINSIDSPVYYDKPVIIRGVRFGKEPIKILVGKDERTEAKPTNNYIEDTVSFIPKYLGFEKGFVPIQIINKYGASNEYYIELK